jgi:hypothetical protein
MPASASVRQRRTEARSVQSYARPAGRYGCPAGQPTRPTPRDAGRALARVYRGIENARRYEEILCIHVQSRTLRATIALGQRYGLRVLCQASSTAGGWSPSRTGHPNLQRVMPSIKTGVTIGPRSFISRSRDGQFIPFYAEVGTRYEPDRP